LEFRVDRHTDREASAAADDETVPVLECQAVENICPLVVVVSYERSVEANTSHRIDCVELIEVALSSLHLNYVQTWIVIVIFENVVVVRFEFVVEFVAEVLIPVSNMTQRFQKYFDCKALASAELFSVPKLNEKRIHCFAIVNPFDCCDNRRDIVFVVLEWGLALHMDLKTAYISEFEASNYVLGKMDSKTQEFVAAVRHMGLMATIERTDHCLMVSEWMVAYDMIHLMIVPLKCSRVSFQEMSEKMEIFVAELRALYLLAEAFEVLEWKADENMDRIA
jgi:hypothetical protein